MPIPVDLAVSGTTVLLARDVTDHLAGESVTLIERVGDGLMWRVRHADGCTSAVPLEHLDPAVEPPALTIDTLLDDDLLDEEEDEEQDEPDESTDQAEVWVPQPDDRVRITQVVDSRFTSRTYQGLIGATATVVRVDGWPGGDYSAVIVRLEDPLPDAARGRRDFRVYRVEPLTEDSNEVEAEPAAPSVVMGVDPARVEGENPAAVVAMTAAEYGALTEKVTDLEAQIKRMWEGLVQSARDGDFDGFQYFARTHGGPDRERTVNCRVRFTATTVFDASEMEGFLHNEVVKVTDSPLTNVAVAESAQIVWRGEFTAPVTLDLLDDLDNVLDTDWVVDRLDAMNVGVADILTAEFEEVPE